VFRELQQTKLLQTAGGKFDGNYHRINPKIGYEKASEIVKSAKENHISIREAIRLTRLITETEFDEIISPESTCRLGN
jgi:fumarate hydratase class II